MSSAVRKTIPPTGSEGMGGAASLHTISPQFSSPHPAKAAAGRRRGRRRAEIGSTWDRVWAKRPLGGTSCQESPRQGWLKSQRVTENTRESRGFRRTGGSSPGTSRNRREKSVEMSHFRAAPPRGPFSVCRYQRLDRGRREAEGSGPAGCRAEGHACPAPGPGAPGSGAGRRSAQGPASPRCRENAATGIREIVREDLCHRPGCRTARCNRFHGGAPGDLRLGMERIGCVFATSDSGSYFKYPQKMRP